MALLRRIFFPPDAPLIRSVQPFATCECAPSCMNIPPPARRDGSPAHASTNFHQPLRNPPLMAHLPRDKGIFLAEVLRRRTLCRAHFELTVSVPAFPEAAPGQFLQILCREPECTGTAAADSPELARACPADALMLRRPFSIGGLRRLGRAVEIDILARVVGPGTAFLDARRPGDRVDLLGPLGRPFSMPSKGHSAILVAGGIGLPPIRWQAEILTPRGVHAVAVVGAQSRDLLPISLAESPSPAGAPTLCAEEFSRHGVPLAVTTDDGSCGLPGRVTDALEPLLRSARAAALPRVFACGPEPMLRAVAALCARHCVVCELAMERVMACGMGTCQSCVIPVHDASRESGWRYALCCTEGPVFPGDAVLWDP